VASGSPSFVVPEVRHLLVADCDPRTVEHLARQRARHQAASARHQAHHFFEVPVGDGVRHRHDHVVAVAGVGDLAHGAARDGLREHLVGVEHRVERAALAGPDGKALRPREVRRGRRDVRRGHRF
jgi:hypothetical protein